MSNYMTAMAMEQNGLAPAAKNTLYWIAYYYDDQTKKCFPSIKRLAEVSEMSPRAVQTHITNLKRMGFLKVAPRLNDDFGKASNSYTLLLKS